MSDTRWRDILHVSTPGFGVEPRRMRLAIVARVAEKHGFTTQELLGKGRYLEVVEARWEAMRELQRTFGDGPTTIGRLFNRDHTTVIHALRKVAA